MSRWCCGQTGTREASCHQPAVPSILGRASGSLWGAPDAGALCFLVPSGDPGEGSSRSRGRSRQGSAVHIPVHATVLMMSFAFLGADSFGCRNIFRKTSDSSCVASSSMEFIPVPPPRTPRIVKRPEPPQQGPGGPGIPPKEDPLVLDMVRSFASVDREDHPELLSPSHHYRALGSPGGLARGNPGERTLSPALLPGSLSPLQTPLHPTLVSFAHEEKNSPPKEEGVCSPSPAPGNGTMQPLGSPNCVKSRGRFPMMGIGQMLRKRQQNLQPSADRPLEASLPPLQPVAPGSLSFDVPDGLKGQC